MHTYILLKIRYKQNNTNENMQTGKKVELHE